MEYSREFLSHVKSLDIDVWLSSPTALPAFTHGSSSDVTQSVCCLIQNMLQSPAGVVPITLVKQSEETYVDTFHNDLITVAAKNICKDSAGLPIGVMVTSMPFHDEVALRVMGEIEKGAQFNHVSPIQEKMTFF
jgi:Asp-tRNA(Asn)/Glu-tRNA(Gln) amidotransferase A subunit family amidase